MFRMRVTVISILSLFALSLLTFFFRTVAHSQEEMLLDGSQFGQVNLKFTQSAINLNMQLEQVLGENPNYELLATYDQGSRFHKLAKPVGRLDILLGNGRMTFCTASIISEKHIITNHHCIPGTHSSPVTQASLLMDYLQIDTPEGTERYPVSVKPVEKNKELDYAILEVEGNPAAKFGTISTEVRDPRPGESLIVIHHPAGLPKHLTRGGCRTKTPKLLLVITSFIFATRCQEVLARQSFPTRMAILSAFTSPAGLPRAPACPILPSGRG